MKIILFGAGATNGSGDVDPCAPPLGKDLFDVLMRLFPTTWGKVPEDVKAEFRSNFESGMGLLIQRHSFAVAPLMQKMGMFFSRFDLKANSENLYIRFFQFLSANKLLGNTLISTLNYECVCEIAASLLGLQIDYFGQPASDNKSVSIRKLHGSCNFQLTGLEATHGISFSAIGVAFDGGIKPLNPSDVSKVYSGNTALYPSMCLYAKGKPISIAPAIIKDMQKQWAEYTKNAEVVCVIGVRPNQEDSHIWQPIADCIGKVCYVGNEKDFDMWGKEYRSGKINLYLSSTWGSSYDQINAHLM